MPPAKPVRSLGCFELLQLLGKSDRTMLWAVHDPRSDQELLLLLPRVQPADAKSMARWMHAARRAARLDHPHLAHAVEVGEQERWPYVAYDRASGQLLTEIVPREGVPASEAARWIAQALDGLAFAHDAGAAHRDVQPHMMVIGDNGQLRLLGLEVAIGGRPSAGAVPGLGRTMSMDTDALNAQRDAAQLDVLATGLVLHRLLANQPALEEPDIARVIARMPPQGREAVRLPWSVPRPVSEALRAIANRATDRQERHRYRGARTLARALEGWLEFEAGQEGGAHAQLLDRVRRIGALPALPGAAVRAARLATMVRERTIELAQIALHDLALAFELLRVVNTAEVRGTQVAGNGPVLTVRRAIALVGLDGVRRASQSLRPWPGPLSESGARDLASLIERVKRAGHVAQALRPAGYDAEVVYVVTLLQNLGRLVVHYHFADEAVQIHRLTLPGEDGEPGMAAETAAFAVLGSDIESMGAAVARHWGLDDSVLHLIRRLPANVPVRQPDHDDDMLRLVASAANEAVDAIVLPARQVQAGLERVVQRYSRVLDLTLRELQSALQLAQQGEGGVHYEAQNTTFSESEL